MSAVYQEEISVSPPSRSCDLVEQVYRLYFNLLLHIACQKFRVPEGDAESLIHEVFVSFLGSSDQVRDPRSWLVGSICNASRAYWRRHHRTEPLSGDFKERSDPGSMAIAEEVAVKISVQDTLARLQEKCRETLRLRYFEGCSAVEVARELDTTLRYAEKLIHKCLKRAHEIYKTLNLVQR